MGWYSTSGATPRNSFHESVEGMDAASRYSASAMSGVTRPEGKRSGRGALVAAASGAGRGIPCGQKPRGRFVHTWTSRTWPMAPPRMYS